jgi:hypothetical protein
MRATDSTCTFPTPTFSQISKAMGNFASATMTNLDVTFEAGDRRRAPLDNAPHAPGGGGRKWMLYSAAIATTSSGFCSFML